MTFHVNRWSVAGGWVLASLVVIGILTVLGVSFSGTSIALIAVCSITPPCVVLMLWSDGLPPTVTDILAAQSRRS